MRPTLPSVVVTLVENDAWLVEILLQSILSPCEKSMFRAYMLRFLLLLKSWWGISTDEKRTIIVEVATKLFLRFWGKRNGFSECLLMSSLPGSIHVAKFEL